MTGGRSGAGFCARCERVMFISLVVNTYVVASRRLRGRLEVGRVSSRRGSGSFGTDHTAGYAIEEGRTSPWLEATLQGSATTMPQAARLGSNDVMLSSFVEALFLCGRSGLL